MGPSNGWHVLRIMGKRAMRAIPLPPPLLAEKIYWGLRFNRWFGGRGCEAIPHFQSRFELYAHLNTSVLKNAAIDYLEFGVAEGASIREWMRLNTQAESHFFGFDTFEGLPEDWEHVGGSTPKGTFGTQGKPPRVENEMLVKWQVGLFQDTLPAFLQQFQPRNRLVVHLDADLHSSTLYVLSMLNDRLLAGSVAIFDEFTSFDNEFRALDDFISAFRRDYRVLACAGQSYDQFAIQFS